MSSFFTYPCNAKYVLLHSNEPRWIVVNRTGLEIARYLDKGLTSEQIIKLFSEKYGIALQRITQDISPILTQLNGFLATRQSKVRKTEIAALYLHLSTRCNLSCAHCYFLRHESCKNSDISGATALHLIDELADNQGKRIVLSGGEPLLHPEIKEILQHAAPRLEIHLLTNGTLIDEQWAQFLATMNIFIQLSIDGSKSEIHDRIRGRGSLVKTLRAIGYLQQAGIGSRIKIATTVTGHNIGDLLGIVALAERLDIPVLRFLPVRMVGNARAQWNSGLALSIKEYEDFYRFIFAHRLERCSPKIDYGLSGLLLHADDFPADNIWCPVGKQLVLDVNGDAYPCVLMMRKEFKLGNAFVDGLTKIIHGKKLATLCTALTTRRNDIEKCRLCQWKNLCQAGCMGLALEHKGTINDADHFCAYRQQAYSHAFTKILATMPGVS